jgi:hypothetical protein
MDDRRAIIERLAAKQAAANVPDGRFAQAMGLSREAWVKLRLGYRIGSHETWIKIATTHPEIAGAVVAPFLTPIVPYGPVSEPIGTERKPVTV